MKKYILPLLMLSLLFTKTASAQLDKKAEDFVKSLTQNGIENIINANISQEEKTKRFEKVFNESLDLDFIGKFVLGKYWRQATPAQQKEFLNAYKQFNIKTWSKRFDEFKGKRFVFTGTKSSNSKNQIFVNSQVPMENAQPASVVWRIRENKGQIKVVDIIIENVSLAITARNEYGTFIKNNNNSIDALINHIQQKTNDTAK